MRLLYDLWYRYGSPPWEIGPREELVRLVEEGRIAPGRALDLGCGSGANVVWLSQQGFDATGVDFASSAIGKARRAASEAGVSPRLLVGDLRRLDECDGIDGTYDLLVDYGTLDDLSDTAREDYLRGVLPLTRPGTRFLLYCFEWEPRWWERALAWVLPFGEVCLLPGEVERRFGQWFSIEEVARTRERRGWPRGEAVYLMERTGAQPDRSPRSG